MNQKQIPHSVQTEQAILATLIIDNQKATPIFDKLNSNMFYDKANQNLFELFANIYKNKNHLNLIIIQDELKKQNDSKKYGTFEAICEFVDILPTTLAYEEYIKIIYEKYMLRTLIEKSGKILTKAYNGEAFDELIDDATKMVTDLANQKNIEDFQKWSELLEMSYQQLLKRKQNGQNLVGIGTGFTYLDRLTHGLEPGEFIVLAARPSMGKTALALNLARNIMFQNDKLHVCFFSLEMGTEQLLDRLLSSESNVSINNVKTGSITGQEQNQIHVAYDQLSKLNFHIDDTGGLPIMALKSKARKLKNDGKLDIIIIDYLQLVTVGHNSKSDNRQQEVSEISRELKALAKELKIPIVALSQLSRGVELRTDKRPMMSDIRESGAIEQDADIIMALYRAEYYKMASENHDISEDGETELIILKNRNGEIGTVHLKFMKEYSKFIAKIIE